jgi:hypothetical protein
MNHKTICVQFKAKIENLKESKVDIPVTSRTTIGEIRERICNYLDAAVKGYDNADNDLYYVADPRTGKEINEYKTIEDFGAPPSFLHFKEH